MKSIVNSAPWVKNTPSYLKNSGEECEGLFDSYDLASLLMMSSRARPQAGIWSGINWEFLLILSNEGCGAELGIMSEWNLKLQFATCLWSWITCFCQGRKLGVEWISFQAFFWSSKATVRSTVAVGRIRVRLTKMFELGRPAESWCSERGSDGSWVLRSAARQHLGLLVSFTNLLWSSAERQDFWAC